MFNKTDYKFNFIKISERIYKVINVDETYNFTIKINKDVLFITKFFNDNFSLDGKIKLKKDIVKDSYTIIDNKNFILLNCQVRYIDNKLNEANIIFDYISQTEENMFTESKDFNIIKSLDTVNKFNL